MSSTSDENRFAPPLAHVEDVAQGPGVLAGRWIRLGATLIDAVVAGLAFGLIALVSPFNVFKPPAASSGLWMLMLQNLVIGFILFLAHPRLPDRDPRPDRRQGAAEDPHRPQRRLAGVVRRASSACATSPPACSRRFR